MFYDQINLIVFVVALSLTSVDSAVSKACHCSWGPGENIGTCSQSISSCSEGGEWNLADCVEGSGANVDNLAGGLGNGGGHLVHKSEGVGGGISDAGHSQVSDCVDGAGDRVDAVHGEVRHSVDCIRHNINTIHCSIYTPQCSNFNVLTDKNLIKMDKITGYSG